MVTTISAILIAILCCIVLFISFVVMVNHYEKAMLFIIADMFFLECVGYIVLHFTK